MKKNQKPIEWTWILLVLYFLISLISPVFAIAGFLCMMIPIVISMMGMGKKHCTDYCPRGSFLGKLISNISLKNKVPAFIKSKMFRNVILVFMVFNFVLSLMFSGGEIYEIARVMFNFMLVSFFVSVSFGVVYNGRTWCMVCPMGHATGLLSKIRSKKSK